MMEPNEEILYDEDGNPEWIILHDEVDPNGDPLIVPYGDA
jgi:hypothetical protein